MDKLVELLRESVLVQATLAFISMAAVIYLAVTGQNIPEILVNAVMLILGFYFGSKAGFSSGLRYGGKGK